MLNRGWRPGLAVLAAFGVVALAAGPGPASAAVRHPGGAFASSAAADEYPGQPAVGTEHAAGRKRRGR